MLVTSRITIMNDATLYAVIRIDPPNVMWYSFDYDMWQDTPAYTRNPCAALVIATQYNAMLVDIDTDSNNPLELS